jgi:hypothetical protein
MAALQKLSKPNFCLHLLCYPRNCRKSRLTIASLAPAISIWSHHNQTYSAYTILYCFGTVSALVIYAQASVRGRHVKLGGFVPYSSLVKVLEIPPLPRKFLPLYLILTTFLIKEQVRNPPHGAFYGISHLESALELLQCPLCCELTPALLSESSG